MSVWVLEFEEIMVKAVGKPETSVSRAIRSWSSGARSELHCRSVMTDPTYIQFAGP